MQFAVTAVCALAVAVAVEPVSLSAIRAAAPEILYVGIFSSGVAFVLQVIGQRYTTPSQAAIFLSSEALFGASLAALLLGETMPVTGYAGCALMFIAMLVVELVPGLTPLALASRVNTRPNMGESRIGKKIHLPRETRSRCIFGKICSELILQTI